MGYNKQDSLYVMSVVGGVEVLITECFHNTKKLGMRMTLNSISLSGNGTYIGQKAFKHKNVTKR